jgi:hypothetical protein
MMGFTLLKFRWMLPASSRAKIFKGKEREGGDDRNPTPMNMGELMPAVKSRCCWRQNLKVVA